MTTTVILNDAQLQQVLDQTLRQKQAIIDSARAGAVPDGQFVFFAAFDGTNNDRANVQRSGNPLSTNVAQLAIQVETARASNSARDLAVGYYAGPGTQGSLTASSWLAPQVVQQVTLKAEQAYRDFAAQASVWLEDHPGGSVTAVVTSFSRGDASAAIFSQMLYARGLIDPNSGQELIPMGRIAVSAGVLFDPVTTGVSGNMAFPPNARNIVDIQAQNEYRYLFRAADYSHQAPDSDPAGGITTVKMLGNHCDIGGGYDHGLGALSLEAATEFFRESGLPIAEVPASRAFDAAKPVAVHSEESDEHGNKIWDVYSSFTFNYSGINPRLTEKVATPATTDAATGATVFVMYDGTSIEVG